MGGHHNTTKAFNYELTGSELYGAPHKLGTRAPQWLPEPRCRASDKQPTPSGPTTWQDDGDGQRRRQTKAEANEDWDSRRRRQSHSGDVRTDSSLTADDTPEWIQNLVLFSCDPLTPEPMKVAAVSATQGPVVEPPQSARFWTCFQANVGLWSVDSPLNVVPAGLTED